MSRYWSDLARTIVPYVAGEQPTGRTYIKLNTNENPYPPSPRVIDAIKSTANERLRLYPDPECRELRTAIAEYYDLSIDEVFVGNSSDEVLAFALPAFFNPGSPILLPDVTYTFYPTIAGLFRIDHKTVPLSADFTIPVEGFFRENGGIIIPNPNAPTGIYLPLDAIRSILDNNKEHVVIIDEAYIDFAGPSAARLILEYPNLLVTQTFSKSRALAGLRVGFALGQRELIQGLDRVKNCINAYTLDPLALAGAAAAMRDRAYFEETTAKIKQTRERVAARLREIGFIITSSQANFVFISHPKVPAGALLRQLREKGILVRYFNAPRIDNYLRVSIGTDEEMDVFLKAIEELIAGKQQSS
ncbi:MAG: histidinol-phosphate transaminase [Nitrospirota bacterium]